jgi:putative oxidoreductase
MTKPSKTLNLFLWITQFLLAATFLWAAYMKLFQSPDKLAAMWPWTANNQFLVKFTGVIDLLAGIGVVLPAVVRIQPKLAVFTAYGIIALMITASIFHVTRGEASQIGFNIFVMALSVFVAWGRSGRQ